MDQARRKIKFGVVDQKIRIYSPEGTESYPDLSITEALELLGTLASNIKRAAVMTTGETLSPTDPTEYALNLPVDKFVTGTTADGAPYLALSFLNFPTIRVGVPPQLLAQTAVQLKELGEAPLDVRKQKMN